MRRRVRGAARGLAALGAVAGLGCAEPPGELVVVVQTDMSLPKDIDTIRIEVLSDGIFKYGEDYPLLGTETGIRLPATIGVVDSEDRPNASARIRAIGKVQGKARVLREVVTQVPPDRVATLHMQLQYLCRGSAQSDPADPTENVVGTCPEGDTCVAGVCRKPELSDEEVAALPEYLAVEVFGGGTGKGGGDCLDVVRCFGSPTPAALDRVSCTLEAPAGDVNVAVVSGYEGMCNSAGCFIALDAGSEAGWTRLADGRIQLPMGACSPDPALTESTAIAAVVTAPAGGACPIKTVAVPTCGPWSAVGGSQDLPAGEPVTLVGGLEVPTGLIITRSSMNQSSVYWTSSGLYEGTTKLPGAVYTAPLAGGLPVRLEEPLLSPRQIVQEGERVYWALQDPGAGSPGAGQNIIRWREKGLIEGIELTGPLQTGKLEGLAATGAWLFWTDFDTGKVMSAKRDGGSPLSNPNILDNAPPVGPSHPFRIVADGNLACWTNEGTHLKKDGSVRCAMRTEATFDQVNDIPDQATPRGIAIDSAAIYWTSFEDGSVRRAMRTGNGTFGPAEDIATLQANPNGIAVDGAAVYWTNWGDGTVKMLRKSEIGQASPSLVASGQERPGALTIRDGAIYWLNEGAPDQAAGRVMRLHPPEP